MLILVAHREWVEWITKRFISKNTLGPASAGPFLCVYIRSKHPKTVIQVRLMPVIGIIILIWGSYASLHATLLSSPTAVLALPVSAAPSRVLFHRAAGSYLALGDSYTIGESVDPADRYPVQAVRLLNGTDHLSCQDPDIIAVTGWTTGNLLDAVSSIEAGCSLPDGQPADWGE
jgi:hypothetical protein